jgi:hypothetical protein
MEIPSYPAVYHCPTFCLSWLPPSYVNSTWTCSILQNEMRKKSLLLYKETVIHRGYKHISHSLICAPSVHIRFAISWYHSYFAEQYSKLLRVVSASATVYHEKSSYISIVTSVLHSSVLPSFYGLLLTTIFSWHQT